MKTAAILAIVLVIIGGFLIAQNILLQGSLSGPATNTTLTISGTQDLVPDEQDLQQLGMTVEEACQTEEYQTNEYSSLAQYTFCSYVISSLNDTEVTIELKKYTNPEDLNGTYQYDSLHLYSVEGLIGENEYGDQSRFRVNNVNDYMGHLNDPGIHVYHLWICKDLYLIHVTSRGTEEAEDSIAETGRLILSKFG